MPLIKLQAHCDQRLLYEGDFPSLSACLEQAVAEHINLDGIDLHNANLINANLDDAVMPNANLSGANLSGANLSESIFTGSNFAGTALYNTCLCYSDLSYCDFGEAAFGATDITGCDLSESRFSTLSTFTLDFNHVRSMTGCVFRDPGGTLCAMSRPPVVIHGLGNGPVILLDHHAKLGGIVRPYRDWLSFAAGLLTSSSNIGTISASGSNTTHD